jgi:hypothetical protein
MEYGEAHTVSDFPQDPWTRTTDELTLYSQSVAIPSAHPVSDVPVLRKSCEKKFKTPTPRRLSFRFSRSRHLQRNSSSSNQDSLSPVQFIPLSSANISQPPPSTVLSSHVPMKACEKQPGIKEEQPVIALVFATVNSFNIATFWYLYYKFHILKSCLFKFLMIFGFYTCLKKQ